MAQEDKRMTSEQVRESAERLVERGEGREPRKQASGQEILALIDEGYTDAEIVAILQDCKGKQDVSQKCE